MYNGLNTDEKKAITSLLNEERGTWALKYANAVLAMNFERPFMVRTLRDKFTVNDVKKCLPGSEWAAMVYFKPGDGCWRGELHAVTLRSNAVRFEGLEAPREARRMDSRKIPNDFFTRGSFEAARKSAKGIVYIVAQLVNDLNKEPAPAREWDLSRLPENERFQYIGMECSYAKVRRIERNGEKISVRPNGGYIYWQNEQIEKLTGKVWVDKSGYMALTRIEQRIQKAKKIRADREKERADRYECGAVENDLDKRLRAAAVDLARIVKNYTGSPAVDSFSLAQTYSAYFRAVKDMAEHRRKVADRAYSGRQMIDMAICYLQKNIEGIENALKEVA
jgi:hypothetical protein